MEQTKTNIPEELLWGSWMNKALLITHLTSRPLLLWRLFDLDPQALLSLYSFARKESSFQYSVGIKPIISATSISME